MCARTNKRQLRRRRSARPATEYYKQPLSEEPPSPDNAERSAAELPHDIMTLIRSGVAETLKSRPGDLSLILRSADSLVRTIAAERRISGKHDQDTAERILQVLDGLGSQLGADPTILPPGPSEQR